MNFSPLHRRGRSLPLMSLLLVVMIAGCKSTPRTTPDPATSAAFAETTIDPGDVVRLTVWGMSCPKCVNNVDQVLGDVDGVTSVHTNMAQGIVTVETGTPAPSARELHDAIVQAGFTPMRIELAGEAP